MIKIFMEGVGRGGGWGGGSSERCLKWGGGGGVTEGSFQKHLKTGGKAKVVRREEGGFEGVTTPPPTRKC